MMRTTEAETTRERTDPDGEDLRLAVGDADESVRREAASRLLGRYGDLVYSWCRRYVGDHERALDMAQEVLLSAYRNLPRYRPRGRFGTWLFVIARNRCLSEMRRPSARELLGLDLDRIPHGNPDPESALEDAEGRDRILRLMRERLDRTEQDALALRAFERLPVESITRMLELRDASGARAVLQRARRKLRAALAETE